MIGFVALLILLHGGDPAWLPEPLPAGAPCPAAHHRPRADGGEICFGEAGANHAFGFVYPIEAARVAALDAHLRHDKDVARDGFQDIIGFAPRFPEDRFEYEEIYTLDASTAELVALSVQVWERAGAEPRRTGNAALLWDRRADAAIGPEALFTDGDAAVRTIRDLACPALSQIREPRFDGECVRPGYDLRPIAAVGGGRIDRLRILLDDLDEDGGGEFEIRIPVTSELLSLVQPRFRASFALSTAPPAACNPALPAHSCPRD